MLRRKFGLIELAEKSLYRARFSPLCRDSARSHKSLKRVAIVVHSIIARSANCVALCAIAYVCCASQVSRAQQPDFSVYARAVEFCRGVAKRPMALDLDKRVLCFDGKVLGDQDFSLANRLEDDGLFVVRSYGGDALLAINLAEVLREKRATIVVYDYCLSACASYLLVASTKAFVLRNTLVAWHHATAAYLCPSLEQAIDGGPKRLEKNTCSDAPPNYKSAYKYYKELDDWFFSMRTVGPFEDPPESVIVRKILRNWFGERGTYPPNLLWTWNPRYYASTIKTNVIYEAYPQSQDEIDALAGRLGVRVIYDP